MGAAEGYSKSGEGISSFLLRHNRSPKKYYYDFIELNKQKLGKNNVLKVGVTYVIPPVKKSSGTSAGNTEAKNTTAKGAGIQQKSSKAKTTKIGTTINEPLFGKELANVKVTSNRLAGACFYVVSGHGGPDPGAIGRVGKHELHEDEYAYDIALRLARNLMQEGRKSVLSFKMLKTVSVMIHICRTANGRLAWAIRFR